MRRKPVAVDWDGTLVDEHGEWLDGAVAFLRRLRKRGYDPFIHSSRANWTGGYDQISLKLRSVGYADMPIEGKPDAVAYLDNLNAEFDGDYIKAFNKIRELAA